MRHQRAIAARCPCSLSLSLCWLDEAQALSLRPVTLEEALADADLVLEGVIETVRNETEDPAAAVPVPRTVYTVRVDNALKGDVRSSGIEFSLMGGEMADGTIAVVAGMPEPQAGQRVIVSLLAINGSEARAQLRSLSVGLLMEVCAEGVCDVAAGATGTVSGLPHDAVPPAGQGLTFDEARSLVQVSLDCLPADAAPPMVLDGVPW